MSSPNRAAVAGGEALLAPDVLRRLVERHAASAPTPADEKRLSVLTSREVEVLRLIGRGESNTEMSRALWVAETTVKTHVTRIFRKLDIRDRAQAVVAYETGVVKRGDAG